MQVIYFSKETNMYNILENAPNTELAYPTWKDCLSLQVSGYKKQLDMPNNSIPLSFKAFNRKLVLNPNIIFDFVHKS